MIDEPRIKGSRHPEGQGQISVVSSSMTMAAGEDAARVYRGHRARRRDGAAPDFGPQPRAISSAKHSHHCAVPGWRNHRHAGAAVRATHVGRLKPKRGRGEVGGAGGSLGADQVAKAAPDGYTLLFHNITLPTTTSSLQSAGRSPHDIEQDFVPIAVGAYVPLLLLSHPSVPARNLKEFVDYARQTKEPLFYGSTGPGSVMNLMGEVLKRDTGITMAHV